jgi:class 3 adenylate cyclase
MGATVRPVGQGVRSRGTLLLADISGYTGFLQGVADAHYDLIVEADAPPPAYELVASLLDGIVMDLVPPFHLVKFEGDAVFVVAADGEGAPGGADLLARLRACHAAFRMRLGEANARWTCTCDACSRIDELDLKFVIHHGDYVVQRVGQQEELLGPDVNAVHRLLKNHAFELIGPAPYALLSDAVVQALDVPADGMLEAIETYDRVPPIPVHVLALA